MKSHDMTHNGGKLLSFLRCISSGHEKKIFLTDQMSLFQGYRYVLMIECCSLVLVKVLNQNLVSLQDNWLEVAAIYKLLFSNMCIFSLHHDIVIIQ